MPLFRDLKKCWNTVSRQLHQSFPQFTTLCRWRAHVETMIKIMGSWIIIKLQNSSAVWHTVTWGLFMSECSGAWNKFCSPWFNYRGTLWTLWKNAAILSIGPQALKYSENWGKTQPFSKQKNLLASGHVCPRVAFLTKFSMLQSLSVNYIFNMAWDWLEAISLANHKVC